jgi:hypothetical protein
MLGRSKTCSSWPSSSPQMVSSLDNWDGSLSSAARQDASRITESAGASTLHKVKGVLLLRMDMDGMIWWM